MSLKKGYFGAGCFWGVEYYFQKTKGVKKVVSGYMGGHMSNPGYRDICTGQTGHYEVVEVTYDDSIVSFEELVKLFFEIHNFTQENGQGPDLGSQYLSVIFYDDKDEKNVSLNIINILISKGYKVVTKLISTLNTPFFKAEDYHQNYYNKTGKEPYCHSYKRIFN